MWTEVNRDQIYCWLVEDDPERLGELWTQADAVRRQTVGEDIHLRGLIEVSNHCTRGCAYCGLAARCRSVTRYRLSEKTIMRSVHQAVELGYGTVVLQSGEDYGLKAGWMALNVMMS